MKFIGKVQHGVQVGEKFGIATANLGFDIVPELDSGVYFVFAQRKGSQEKYEAIMHFGERPTFGRDFSAEVHLLDFSEDLYGTDLNIEVLKKTRAIQKFQNADQLFTQIEKDILKARKFFIRNKVKSSWKNLSREEKGILIENILNKIFIHNEFVNAERVFAFSPLSDEISFVEKLCKKFPQKQWYFPRVEEGGLVFYASKYSELTPGKFGILEPDPSKEKITQFKPLDVVFVPGVAADVQNNRLGRGGGYYDSFLSKNAVQSILVLPNFAVFNQIPTEDHDQKVSEVIVAEI